jgi:hypothetical protein
MPESRRCADRTAGRQWHRRQTGITALGVGSVRIGGTHLTGIGLSARLSMAVAMGLLASTVLAPAATAAAEYHVDELRIGSAKAVNIAAAPGPCADAAYRLLGATWPKGSYSWSYHAPSTPKYLPLGGVVNVLSKSFDNIANANNDCGLPDNVSATHSYLGSTATKAKCGRRDNKNVIGFKALEFGVLAVTCYWTRAGRMVEADMQITTREQWALSNASCSNEMILEATITHEAGHVFGLDHVGERKHGRLTMSPYIDGSCDDNESTLGWGDIRGLEAMY